MIAADSERRLWGADHHAVLAHAGNWLHDVEAALVDLVTSREARSGRSSLWCAARALDASAVVRGRLQQRPPPYRELVELLEVRLERQHGTRPSATAAAVGLRVASRALEELAQPAPACDRALRDLDAGVVALAALAVALWEDVRGARAADGRSRLGSGSLLTVVRAAGLERQLQPTRSRGADHWLDAALRTPAPTAELELVGRRDGDRVLRADAVTAVRSAWIVRGARELLVLQALGDAGRAARTGHGLRDIARRHPLRHAAPSGHAASPALAWQHHSHALRRVADVYAGRAGDEDVHTSFLAIHRVLGGALRQISALDAELPGGEERGSRVAGC